MNKSQLYFIAKQSSATSALPPGYIFNYTPAYVGDSTVQLRSVLSSGPVSDMNAARSLTGVTVSEEVDMIIATALVIDASVVGPNGLDTGVFAAGWYALYVISKAGGADVAGLCSINFELPTLPAAYTKYRYVGSAFAVEGEGVAFVPFYCQGLGNDRQAQFRSQINVLTAGAATIPTEVDVSDAVPPHARYVLVRLTADTAAAAGTVFLDEEFGNSPHQLAVIDTQAAIEVVTPIQGSSPRTLQYHVVGADVTCTIDVLGYFESV